MSLSTMIQFAPPTDSPYMHLAMAVLEQALLDMKREELHVWLLTDTCRFWCDVAGVAHTGFCTEALRTRRKLLARA